MEETQTIIVATETDERWLNKESFDLAFTQLTPDAASSLAAKNHFLNIDKNRGKVEAGLPPTAKYYDALFGLVAEFSEQPFKENGKFVSPMRSLL